MEGDRELLADELGRFFHRELDRRYNREHLAEVPAVQEEELLEDVPQEHLDRIGEFFKRVMYPVGEERRARDRGVETVESILSDTTSLLALLPRIPGILLNHGPKLPKVTSAGLQVVSAYRLSRRMERKVIDELAAVLEEEGIELSDGGAQQEIPERLFREAERAIEPEEASEVFDETEKIVRLGMDPSLMETTRDLVDLVAESRKDPGERESLGYVATVIEEVRSLALEFDKDQVERVLRLSELNEFDYFRRLHRQSEERD